MLRPILMISAILTPISAHASPSAVQTAERDGIKFEYTRELTPNGLVRLSGRLLPSRERFNLLVDKSGHVSGDFGGGLVDYDVPASDHAAIVSSLMAPSTTAATANAVQLIAPVR